MLNEPEWSILGSHERPRAVITDSARAVALPCMLFRCAMAR
jgi:hypothetical protein